MVSFQISIEKERHSTTKKQTRRDYLIEKTRGEVSYLFKFLLITQVVVYLEAGAIPCLLDQLSVSLQMNATQQGALGGIVYLTLSAASPLCAYFLQRYNPKYMLGMSLILNNLAVLTLAFIPTGYSFSANLMVFARGLIGFSQAFSCVFTPLWVDEYAPREKVAGWMSYFQGSVPMGVMLGYFLGTVSNWIAPEDLEFFKPWRWPFIVQFLCMCPIMTGVFFVPKRHLAIRHEDRLESPKKFNQKSNSSSQSSQSSSGGSSEELDTIVSSTTATTSPTLPITMGRAGSGPPSSFSGMMGRRSSLSTRHEEEDALLASSGMYGSNTQQGLRILHQHHHEQQLLAVEADSSLRRSRLGSYDPESQEALAISIASTGGTTIAATGTTTTKYGTVETKTVSPLSTASVHETSSFYETTGGPGGEGEFIIDQKGPFIQGIKELLQIPTYSLIVFGLTAVYFVVTGVQYWSTIFMIKSLHASKYIVNGLFVIVAGTGPILGVFFGGWLIDEYGGYIGIIQRAKALGICMVLGVIANIIAAGTTFFNDIYITAACLWLLLFFGGAILPACAGISISVVPLQHRALASSFSVMIFNLLGYSLSPYLTGFVMEWVLSHHGIEGSYFEFCDEACAYRIGFRFCLCWCLWSFVAIGTAWLLAKKEAKQFIEQEEEQQEQEETQRLTTTATKTTTT